MSNAPANKPPTKTEVINNLATATGFDKKEVTKFLDALADEMKKALGPDGPGAFALPGLIKIERKIVPAKPAQLGVPDRFRPGVVRDIPAKPASTKVRFRALKDLKDMVK